MTTQRMSNGEFHFDAVPLGEYTVTVSSASFASEEQKRDGAFGHAPVLHFELHLAAQSNGHGVCRSGAGAGGIGDTDDLVDREEIRRRRERRGPTAWR